MPISIGSIPPSHNRDTHDGDPEENDGNSQEYISENEIDHNLSTLDDMFEIENIDMEDSSAFVSPSIEHESLEIRNDDKLYVFVCVFGRCI